MSERFDFDLTEVDDFEDIKLEDASTYQDQTGMAPQEPGNYRFRVVEASRRKDKDGQPINDNGYPQFQVSKLEIVEPEELAGRFIYPFKSYSLKPVAGGKRQGSVPAVDLLRGFDDTLTYSSGKEVLQLLAEQIESGKTFVASTNWTAKDSQFIKDAIEEAGGDLDGMGEEEKRELFKKAIFRGQKAFPKTPNGGYLPEVVGPSGDTLEARIDLTRIYPASKEVKKMGPFKKRTN